MSSSYYLKGWAQPPSTAAAWRTLLSNAALFSPQQSGFTSSVRTDWAIHPSAAESPTFRPNQWPREPLVESNSHWEQGTSSFHNDSRQFSWTSFLFVLVSIFLKYSTVHWSDICTFSYINNGKRKKSIGWSEQLNVQDGSWRTTKWTDCTEGQCHSMCSLQ